MALTIDQLNAANADDAARLLDGLYEHSPWIAQQAVHHRPFRSLVHLKQVMADIVRNGGAERQLALIRAHPELAGKAMVAKSLTSESTSEQSKAGLTHCSPEEFARLQELNTAFIKIFIYFRIMDHLAQQKNTLAGILIYRLKGNFNSVLNTITKSKMTGDIKLYRAKI